MSEERREDFSNEDIDREFAAIVRQATAHETKPTWYLVPLRILCAMTFFMTLSLCIVANGGVMTESSWGTATLISFCVAVATGICRRLARARYDRGRR
ncbi:hypothetical protein [Streptomyces sp. WG-D5]